MQRILIVGTSGSGKSTLAKKLSELLDLPYVKTDAFYWKEGWQQASTASVIEQVTNVLKQDTWVMDGNFEDQRQLVWARADTIIWLDLPKQLTLFRVLRRNLYWVLTRKKVWSGNQMTWARAWSGFRHAMRSYDHKKQNYPSYFVEFKHVKIIRFESKEEVAKWVKTISV